MFRRYCLHLPAVILICISCSAQTFNSRKIIPGAEKINEYLPLLKGKSVAIVANQTSVVNKTHTVDTLKSLGVAIKCVFAPEHGFRGEAEAGELVKDGIDKKTGIPVISLYGNHKKPTDEELHGVDMVLFDIQDVGVRFYTYISTLQYIMESCASNGIPVLVLDRPNPHGYYIDGPVLDTAFRSFVGMNPIPVVHGLTVAEYALMLNGEKWLEKGIQCELYYIKMDNWDHSVLYNLPVPPSPNLPDMSSVYLYPSLCFFEGTVVSVGRGTDRPFQVIGFPGYKKGSYEFTPKSIKGKAVHPLYEGVACRGYNLTEFGYKYMRTAGKLYIYWLIDFYKDYGREDFFNDFFDKLAGTDTLRKQIMQGMDETEIARSWKPGLEDYKLKRMKYLLYKDF